MTVLSGAVYADDLVPGHRETLGSHTMTEREIIAFADQWDPQYFHVDPARAQADSRFGGLIASGLHTLSVYHRLWVLSRAQPWQVIAGAAMRDLTFLRPVRPGDVLTGRSVVDEVHLEPEKQRGLVSFNGELINQHHKLVLGLTVSAYLEARTA